MTHAGSAPSRGTAFLKAGSSAVVSQVIAFLLLPFLFRAYGPVDFGRWATLQAVIMATVSLSTLRYDLAIVTEENNDSAGLLFWICCGLGLVIAATAAISGTLLVGALDPASWPLSTIALSVGWLFAASLNQPLQSWLLRQGRFGAASLSIVLATGTANLGQLGMALIWPDHRGLIAGSALGACAGCGLAALLCLKAPPRWSMDIRIAIGPLLRKHRRFLQFSLPFTVLSLLRERAPVLILAAFTSPLLIGVYSQAWRLVHLPAGLSSGALRPVIFHAAARSGAASVAGPVQHLITGMALLAAPWLGVLIADPEALFGFVLGDAWRDAGRYAAVLAIPAMIFMLTNWLDRLLDVVHRQDANLKLEVLASILSVGGFAAALGAGATVFSATLIQATGLLVSYISLLVVVYRICKFPLLPLLKIGCTAVVLGFATWGAAIAVSSAVSSIAGLIAGLIAAGLLTGFVALRLARPFLAAIAVAK